MKLIAPSMVYDRAIQELRRDFLADGGPMDGAGALRRCERTEDWLADIERMKSPETVPDGLWPCAQYLYLRETDGCAVGLLQCRYPLDDYLERYVGNVGYSVRPSERRRGYATRMLHDALPLLAALGQRSVLLSCRIDNEASRKVILRNGGIYLSTVLEPRRQVWLERYQIDL